MQKVLLKEEEKLSYLYKDHPIPEPKEGEVLVKVSKVSICGSDIALYNWNQGLSNISSGLSASNVLFPARVVTSPSLTPPANKTGKQFQNTR